MDTELLRKEVKKLMIDRDLDRPGSVDALAKVLDCNSNQLTMALTGYRQTPRSVDLLQKLLILLLTVPEESGRD